jgi:hypothetical protein
MFTDPAMRRLHLNWSDEAQRLLAQYRAAAGQHAGDPSFESLTTALHQASSHFREWWQQHNIAGFEPARKQLHHPSVGLLTLDYVKLAAVEAHDIKLVAFLPADLATAEKLPSLHSDSATPNSGQRHLTALP